MGTEHAELSDSEIVFGYRKGEVPGQTVMRRLLEKCEKSAELADEVMKKSDGSIMTGPDGSPLVVDQYFTVAEQHPGAVDAILGFVMLDDADPRFPGAKHALGNMIDGYLGQIE